MQVANFQLEGASLKTRKNDQKDPSLHCKFLSVLAIVLVNKLSDHSRYTPKVPANLRKEFVLGNTEAMSVTRFPLTNLNNVHITPGTINYVNII